MANQNKKLNQRRRKAAILKAGTPVSMHDLLREVGKIAAQVNETYYACRCEIKHNRFGELLDYEYWVYINNYSWQIGGTPAEALDKLRLKANPKPPIDVVI